MQASRRGAWRCARGLRTERVCLLWRPHPRSFESEVSVSSENVSLYVQ